MVCVLPYSKGDQIPTIYKIFFLLLSSSVPVTALPASEISIPYVSLTELSRFLCPTVLVQNKPTMSVLCSGAALSSSPRLCFQPPSGHVNCCLIAPLTQHTPLSPLSSHLSLFPILYWHHQPPLLLPSEA